MHGPQLPSGAGARGATAGLPARAFVSTSHAAGMSTCCSRRIAQIRATRRYRRGGDKGRTRFARPGRRTWNRCWEAIAEIIGATPQDVVLDAGCGDGYYLGMLARQTGLHGRGVDISLPAIESAARRYPGHEWIVANADRFLPYDDRSFTAILFRSRRG